MTPGLSREFGRLRRVVPGGRVELPLSCENRILSPARLPVPPSGPSFSSSLEPSSNTNRKRPSMRHSFIRRTCVIECLSIFRRHPMTEVQCVKCGKPGEPITDPLYLGRLEAEVKAKVCKTCWKQWEA